MEKSQNNAHSEFSFVIMRPDDTSDAWNQGLKVVFILQGNGWLHLSEANTAYSLHEEDIFVINSFQLHSIVLEKDAIAIALLLSPFFLTALSPETQDQNVNCKSFLYGEDKQQSFDQMRRNFAKAFRAQYKNESPLSVHLRSCVAVLADGLFRNFLNQDNCTQRESGRERIRTAVDYIHRCYSSNITLMDLAEHTYLSTSYISRSFQKHLGITFTGYLTQVRLLHASAMLSSDSTITEIAYINGFSSTNAFIDSFKHYHSMTPGQYRRDMAEKKKYQEAQQFKEPAEEGFSTIFASLMKYADEKEVVLPTLATAVCEISAALDNVRCQLKHTWKRVINAGYAKDILDISLQRQITLLQQAAGFQFIRCKGVLDDDMMVFSGDIYGNLSFNYVYIDRIIDFILSVGAKPMLELGHMPSALAQRKEALFRRPAIISAPSNMSLWKELIYGVMDHLAKRYGISEMQQWLFTPWICIDFISLDFFTREEYYETYKASFQEIKRVDASLKVCGPGNSIYETKAFAEFVHKSKEMACLPDIFTFRSFAAIVPEKEECGLKLLETNEAFSVAVSGDEAYLSNQLKNMKKVMQNEQVGQIPIMLDEWSNNVWQRDLCNDTCYKSAYLFKSIMENHDCFYGLGYFNIADELGEIAPAAQLFHGGFGLFTRNGIPKSAFRAMELLARAGDGLIASGEGYFITTSDKEVQIYLHNYCHYDMLYRYRNTTRLSMTERYKVFNEKQTRSYHIQLEGFIPGNHIIKSYSIGRNGGSSYDMWLTMGAPQEMTQEEELILERNSYPVYRTQTVCTDTSYRIRASLQPHEVQLITISR